MLKRAFDISLSIIGLLSFFPGLLLVAFAIKFDDCGPVLYRARRVGRSGKFFHILKFRTMVIDADKVGGSSTPADDPRVTRLGRALRRYKLDELPQLFNVLVGDMSFVGPRPQVEWAVELYTDVERKLLSVRPGITDYASLLFRDEGAILRGSRDPDKDYLEKIAPMKNRLGIEYISNQSLSIDIIIIVATLGAILGVDPEWCLPERSPFPFEPENEPVRAENR